MQLVIHIIYEFREGPWGGGNQFLKALRDYFSDIGVYSNSPEEAQVILFNSHHCLNEVFRVKKRYPNKILVHRVDGSIAYVRGRDKVIDEVIFRFNSLLADGTIFQSNWSRERNYEIGMRKSPYETIIMNAPSPRIFGPEGKKAFDGEKIKLVATSWSGNMRRGFETYQYLDEQLDFSRYEMTFVGNSPIGFKNIRWEKPVSSREIAKILKEHDIYITASKNDPCSNSLIEALHCGLPAVARNDGGHPEIVGQAGQLFEDENEIISAIEKVAQNYEYYKAKIDQPTLDEVGQRYYEFSKTIYEDSLGGNYLPKQVNFWSTTKFMKARIEILWWRTLSRLSSLSKEVRCM